ncbi:MAG: hypothetical protein JWO02_1299 [Solirubrobacterales bacterium]|nr:hypothetical protein [Solirubrobacterales bacterium]
MPTMPLPPAPATLVCTRQALHLVAEQILAAACTPATGNEIALEARPGGFGTPPLPDGGWVGVDGARLSIGASDGTFDEHTLTTLHAAATLAGLVHGPMPDAPLAVDPVAADMLATVFAFGDATLNTLRAEAPADAAPSLIRLWPERFDIAYEEGNEAAGTRAGFGISPGDDDHSQPYAYVTPWSRPPVGPLWNATAFSGAELPYEDLRAAADPVGVVLTFWRARRDTLRAVRAAG